MAKLVRINAGCGILPIANWINFDNSMSVYLAHHAYLTFLLRIFSFLSEDNINFINIAKINNITWANAARNIPMPDNCADVVYSCHMLEHLTADEISTFLSESKRVLAPGGILRIVVPDLANLIEQYNRDNDADAFMKRSWLSAAAAKPVGLGNKLKFFIIGFRHHIWMYNAKSLANLLSRAGFKNPTIQPSGQTMIPHPEGINLYQRDHESLYIEAKK